MHHQGYEFELLSIKCILKHLFAHCLCSYSRKVLWVKASRTNRNPKVVAANFLDFLKHEGLAPRVIRMDRGSENVTIAAIQRAIRSFDNDRMAGDNSVILGPSTSNQVRDFDILISYLFSFIFFSFLHMQNSL